TAIAPVLWWLSDPATWPLRAVPYYWTVTALWHPTWLGLLIGAALTAVAIALLARQTLRRLTSRTL
ncbi:hypothetical protein, partial [Actinophytocola sp.]|uniref:hypothetical protein n=1 Tax=Actinophytocola sp. TaxID=1872138 RepID=UPI002D7E8157